jgi:hypothetical protein
MVDAQSTRPSRPDVAKIGIASDRMNSPRRREAPLALAQKRKAAGQTRAPECVGLIGSFAFWRARHWTRPIS